jgi:hypothetical protein
MKPLLRILSYIGLLLTVVPSVLVFAGSISLDLHKQLMAAGMLLWFLTAPFWMNLKEA